jgi:hypothetical protein
VVVPGHNIAQEGVLVCDKRRLVGGLRLGEVGERHDGRYRGEYLEQCTKLEKSNVSIIYLSSVRMEDIVSFIHGVTAICEHTKRGDALQEGQFSLKFGRVDPDIQ